MSEPLVEEDGVRLVLCCKGGTATDIPLFETRRSKRIPIAVQMLTELIFGTAPVAFRKPAVKLHVIPSVRTAIVTRLFVIIPTNKEPPSATFKAQQRQFVCGAALLLTSSRSSFSHLLRFVTSHFPLLERHLSILEHKCAPHINISAPSRYCLQENKDLEEITRQCVSAIHALLTFPRLRRPLWMQPKASRAATLLEALNTLAALDTPATAFFVSASLTAVLQHHLGWMQRVQPTGRSSDALTQHIRAVYGAVNDVIPTRVVLVGSDRSHLHAFIQTLSYLIRAAPLAETVATPASGDILEPDEPMSPQSTSFPTSKSPSSPNVSVDTHFRRLSFSSESEDFSSQCQHVPMPQAEDTIHRVIGVDEDSVDWRRNMVSSLAVGLVHDYASDFSLMALTPSVTFFPQLVRDLREASQHPIAGAVQAAACVLIDVNARECDLLVVDERDGKRAYAAWEGQMYEGLCVRRCRKAQHVRDTVMATVAMLHHGVPDTACEEYFDARLHELRARAELMSKYIRSLSANAEITESSLGQALGVADDDIPLLLSIAAVDDPGIRSRVQLAL